MKRMISLLTSLALLASAASLPVSAEGTSSPDLAALASSLGADNGFFSRTALAYIDSLPTDGITSTEYAFYTQYAVAVLQILVHNGVISPSDIKPGASALTDIEPDSEVDAFIASYLNGARSIKPVLYFGNSYCHTSQKSMADKLIAAAETSMKSGRYFLVAFRTEDSTFMSLDSIASPNVGIGIADGSWTFDGKTYDKCILTLSPSSSAEPDPEADIQTADYRNAGFSEKNCIYVNSETGAFTVPSMHGCTDEGQDIYIVCDDDALLNYREGDAEFAADTSDLHRVWFNDNANLEYTVDGKYSGRYGSVPEDMVESYMYYNDDDQCYIGSGESFRLETTAGKGAFRGNHTQTEIRLNYDDELLEIQSGGAFIIDASHDKVSVEKKPESFTTENDWINADNEFYEIDFEPYEGYMGMSTYYFAGNTKGKVTFEVRDDGFYVESDSLIKGAFGCWYSSDPMKSQGVAINANQPVMVKYDDTDGEWYIFRDGSGDGSFSEKVKKGDANCDGKLDARDASIVLCAYADMSGGSSRCYLDPKYADMNGDGKINASDASALLRQYAELSG